MRGRWLKDPLGKFSISELWILQTQRSPLTCFKITRVFK